MTPYQERVINALLEHKDKTIVEVAALIGGSPSRVSAINKIYNIRPVRMKRSNGVHAKGIVGEVLTKLSETFTIAEIEALSGLNYNTIAKIRQGRNLPNLFTFQVLADTAGLEIKLVPKESKQ